jgi:hypothetical protein
LFLAVAGLPSFAGSRPATLHPDLAAVVVPMQVQVKELHEKKEKNWSAHTCLEV